MLLCWLSFLISSVTFQYPALYELESEYRSEVVSIVALNAVEGVAPPKRVALVTVANTGRLGEHLQSGLIARRDLSDRGKVGRRPSQAGGQPSRQESPVEAVAAEVKRSGHAAARHLSLFAAVVVVTEI